MKTILYLSGDPLQYGGGATVCLNILKNIEGDDLQIVTSNYALLPEDIGKKVKVRKLWMPRNRILLEFYDQIVAPIILFILGAQRVVCLNSIVPLLYPGRIDVFFQMRMFHFPELDNFSKKLKNILGVMSIYRAGSVYCASKDHGRDLELRLNLKRDKIKVIHLGVSAQNETTDTTVRRKKHLLFVSVFRPYKNLHGLVRAVIKAKATRPDFPIELHVVGKPANYPGMDAYMEKLTDLIENSNYPEIVRWVGPLEQKDVFKALRRCGAFVFPTRFEGFGLPLLEAMATSTPVICSSVNSLPEVGGDTVVYFNPDDEEMLVNRILNFYENGYPTELVTKALARSQLFSWHSATQALINDQSFIVHENDFRK
ncbi:MAG: glycosyltransferase family 4 protein [Gammaproteobacteria bacterium]|nr:glycosyltransferase family 4 protein [Gammaproteobacteria bacterium]